MSRKAFTRGQLARSCQPFGQARSLSRGRSGWRFIDAFSHPEEPTTPPPTNKRTRPNNVATMDVDDSAESLAPVDQPGTQVLDRISEQLDSFIATSSSRPTVNQPLPTAPEAPFAAGSDITGAPINALDSNYIRQPRVDQPDEAASTSMDVNQSIAQSSSSDPPITPSVPAFSVDLYVTRHTAMAPVASFSALNLSLALLRNKISSLVNNVSGFLSVKIGNNRETKGFMLVDFNSTD